MPSAAPGTGEGERSPRRAWLRAAALLALTMGMSVLQPLVLVAFPFLVLVSLFGIRRLATVPAVIVSALVAISGWPRDGLWYVERAWALVLGGWFAALTLMRPGAPAMQRALGAVVGAWAAGAAALSLDGRAWGGLDWAVADRMTSGLGTVLEALRTVRGETLDPAFVTALYETVETQMTVFPAVLGLASMAALGFSWWLYVRLAEGSDRGLGPFRDFRFNDHLVWVFIGGLGLLLASSADLSGRVGSNAVLFMGALYALRGAAVLLFLSGGFSVLAYMLLGFTLLLVPSLIVGATLVVGLGDTWLRFRARAEADPS